MPGVDQIFSPIANTIARFSLLGVLVLVVSLFWFFEMMQRSTYYSQRAVVHAQPVQFSHEHHVGGLGIDCRYCHASVDDSSFADLPPTHTCMTCHSQIWINSPALERVRASYQTGQSIAWNRVNNLPDYVYFNHQIHVTKGIG